MKQIFREIAAKIKAVIAFPHHQRVFLHHTVKTPELEKTGRYAVIHMDRQFREDDYSRHLLILCKHMERAGFKPIVKMEWRDVKNIDGYGFRKYLWRENFVFVRSCNTPVNTIVLKIPGTADHTINIQYGYTIQESTTYDCIAPFPMDPTQVSNYSEISNH